MSQAHCAQGNEISFEPAGNYGCCYSVSVSGVPVPTGTGISFGMWKLVDFLIFREYFRAK